jgi:3-dehydroquinate synthase
MTNLDFPRAPAGAFAPGRVVTSSTGLAEPSPLHFGFDVEGQLVDALAAESFDRLFLVVDEGVPEATGSSLPERLEDRFDCRVLRVPGGEASKRFARLEELCERLVEAEVSKRSLLVAFGGGAIGNLVGLASGLVYRGIRYVEVPTTMTGQTDSTLSNKQAVNGRLGKNHFGLYHSPLFVWSDVRYLRSEPATARRGGLVETVKNGFVSDAALLDWLAATLDPSAAYSDASLVELTWRSIQSKLAIIARDPGEKGEGLILEYGHTFGHAIEALRRGETSHGEAVALGMLLAAELACELGLIDERLVERHRHLIVDRLGASAVWPAGVDAEALVVAMRRDNKRTGAATRFVLLAEAGRCHDPEGDFLVTVPPEVVMRVTSRFVERQRAGAAA